MKTSQEQFEEITGGWSIANHKAIPQELQEALNHQQQLCDALIEDKKKLINDLQQVTTSFHVCMPVSSEVHLFDHLPCVV